MCGIVGVISNRRNLASPLVETLYNSQRTRGTSGFGACSLDDGATFKSMSSKDVFKWASRKNPKALLFHHRYPTSTAASVQGCHPYVIKHGVDEFIVVHNGVISNPADVLEKLGIAKSEMTSLMPDGRFNDSEALAYDFVDALLNGREELHSKGYAAVVCYDKTNRRVYFFREGAPLQFTMLDGEIVFASDAPFSAQEKIEYEPKALTYMDLGDKSHTVYHHSKMRLSSWAVKPTVYSAKPKQLLLDEKPVVQDRELTPFRKTRLANERAAEKCLTEMDMESTKGMTWQCSYEACKRCMHKYCFIYARCGNAIQLLMTSKLDEAKAEVEAESTAARPNVKVTVKNTPKESCLPLEQELIDRGTALLDSADVEKSCSMGIVSKVMLSRMKYWLHRVDSYLSDFDSESLKLTEIYYDIWCTVNASDIKET